MIRNLKALGLALVAVFAMSAVAASAAQAETTTPHFTAYNTETKKHESAHFVGTADNTQVFTAGAGAGAIECEEGEVEGASATGTDTTLTATFVEYRNCFVGGPEGLKADVSMNECHYTFHIGAELVAEMEYAGTVDLVCPAGKEVDINVTKADKTTKCTIKIPGQNGLGPIRYTNNTNVGEPTDVTVHAEVTNVKNTTEGTKANCGVSPGEHTGTYSGTTTVKAFNTEGVQIDGTIMPVSTP